jgi:hypothetical protein
MPPEALFQPDDDSDLTEDEDGYSTGSDFVDDLIDNTSSTSLSRTSRDSSLATSVATAPSPASSRPEAGSKFSSVAAARAEGLKAAKKGKGKEIAPEVQEKSMLEGRKLLDRPFNGTMNCGSLHSQYKSSFDGFGAKERS